MFATPAYAQTATAPAAAPAGGGPMDLLAGPLPLLVVLMGLMYFMMIRPQQRRAKAHTQMVSAIKRGDVIVMSNGMIGKVSRVEDAELAVEIAAGTVVKVVRSMVSEVRPAAAPTPANDPKPKAVAPPKGPRAKDDASKGVEL